MIVVLFAEDYRQLYFLSLSYFPFLSHVVIELIVQSEISSGEYMGFIK